MDEGNLLGLIDSVYEAAVDPAKYHAFLERLSDAVRGRWTMLIAHDSRACRAAIPLSVGIDPAVVRRAQELTPSDPSVVRARPFLRAGEVFTGEMLLSDQELLRTEMYNEVLRPNGLRHTIFCVVADDELGAALISSARPERLGPFDQSEIRIFKILEPHLKRAFEIQQKLAMTEGRREALDRIPAGCLLLGAGGRILFANRAAEQIFLRGDGVSTFGGQLCAGVQIRNLIGAVTSDCPTSHPGGVAAVPRLNSAQPYSVLVAPLPRRPVDWGGRYPLAVAFIADPTPPSKMEFILRALYRLTRAEARLAQALANGHGLSHAAEELGITLNTAKAQIQQIFSKTQTNRQAELVRLLTAMAWNTQSAEFQAVIARSGDDN